MTDETLYESVEKLRDWVRAIEWDASVPQGFNLPAEICERIDTLLSQHREGEAKKLPSPDKVRGILRDEVVMDGGEPHVPLEVANRHLREVERERDQQERFKFRANERAERYEKALNRAGIDFRTIAGMCTDEDEHRLIDSFAMESSDRTADALCPDQGGSNE